MIVSCYSYSRDDSRGCAACIPHRLENKSPQKFVRVDRDSYFRVVRVTKVLLDLSSMFLLQYIIYYTVYTVYKKNGPLQNLDEPTTHG